MKKGMFFTLSAIVITALLVVLANVIVDSATDETVALERSNGLARAQVLHASLERALQTVFVRQAGIGIDIDDSTVTFNEELPNNNVQGFRDAVDDLAAFVQASNQPVTLSASTFKDDPVLRVLPDNITYSHNTFGNDILITHGNGSAEDYYVLATTDELFTLCLWSFTPGSTSLRVRVEGFTTNILGQVVPNVCDRTELVDPSVNNTVTVVNALLTTASISLFNDGDLAISGSLDMNVSTRLQLPDQGEDLTVRHPSVVVVTNASRLGVERNDGVRIV